MPDPTSGPTCFVVQGFGKKTEYADGRVLDLDASYAVIRQAVQDAGMVCIRCDEVVHSGSIDARMYEQLMRADLVIADLSTSNINAAFELGVRYGLRPYATIIVAEEGFKQPFDVNHTVIRRYKHLGEDIGVKEANRFRTELTAAIRQIVAAQEPDSPVYTFLGRLLPPREKEATEEAIAATARALDASAGTLTGARGGAPDAAATKQLVDTALAMINPPHGTPSNFAGARMLLKMVLDQSAGDPAQPPDPFVVQQLALATYKSKQPAPLEALLEAHKLLQRLGPANTNDPETLGLWGAVHKRLWELQGDPAMLSEAIAAYSRGFYLKQDYYNGVNLAFLLETRALDHAGRGDRDDVVADRVLARRTREDVLRYATPQVAALAELGVDKRYWLTASLWETATGLGRDDEARSWEAQARAMKPALWMLESTEQQVAQLLKQQARLAAALAAPSSSTAPAADTPAASTPAVPPASPAGMPSSSGAAA